MSSTSVTTRPSETQPKREDPAGLLTALLVESQELTAVERFSRVHDESSGPAQAKYYRDLLPLTTPGQGEQYAFDVDLDKCSGCKACVSACHNLNGLEAEETWRSVGQLYGQNGLPIIQHITTACHHCVDPGCLNGCPTNAYEKDPQTGIVRHLDDQCFGCQYCTMACPYEVPQYSESKGIVRKCDMCHGRLAAGEAPACVQACPSEAISITIVDSASVVEATNRDEFLPSSPPAQLTHPTTRYRSANPLPSNLEAADGRHAEPQHAHYPLVAMLVLTQLSVGAVMLGAAARWLSIPGGEYVVVAGTLAGLAGLGLAPLHLGRPHLAFRSVLGWRHSWLSREAIVFGLYAPMAIGASCYALTPHLASWLPGSVYSLLITLTPGFARAPAELLAVLAGTGGVFCSAKIYQFTGREFWLGFRTLGKFAGTGVVLGASLLMGCVSLSAALRGESIGLGGLASLVVASAVAKLSYEAWQLFGYGTQGPLALTARLMLGELRRVTAARFAMGLAGGVLLPVVAWSAGGGWAAAVVATLGFACLALAELSERILYFSAVVPLRMPGGIKS